MVNTASPQERYKWAWAIVAPEEPHGSGWKHLGVRPCPYPSTAPQPWPGWGLHPRTCRGTTSPPWHVFPPGDITGWETLGIDRCVCFCSLLRGRTLLKHPAPEVAAVAHQLEGEALSTAFP